MENELAESLKEDRGTGCTIPQTDFFDREILNFDYKNESITCNGTDWVKCYIGTCKVDPMILSSVKNLICEYKDIMHYNDFEVLKGPSRIFEGDHKYKLYKSDYVEVHCWGDDNRHSSEWRGLAAGFRPIHPVKPPAGRENTYNVLIFAFESTSKNTFIRKMPLSYKFLNETLKSIIFNGYNIVGGSTRANMFPILTGKSQIELPDWRKYSTASGPIDPKYFLFHKLKMDGYRTAYLEEHEDIGTFQHVYNGFAYQPTDHYLRDFYLAMEAQGNTERKSKYCAGDTPKHKLIMNLTDQFFQLDGKKFALTFIDISHDDAQHLSNADEDLAKFLEGLMRRGVFENTLLILMGEHGTRFNGARESLEGKLEERMPLLSIRLPDKFKCQRPDAQSALELNADVLTTPFDVYPTILEVVGMTEHCDGYMVRGANLRRGLTLLKPIPKTRSCSEAGVESHWCTCLKWKKVDSSDPLYNRTAQALVDHINYLTDFVDTLCARRYLTAISCVVRQQPNNKLLLYNHTDDFYNYYETSPTYKLKKQTYQVKIEVSPVRGMYKAVVTHLFETDQLFVNTTEISRTNRYFNQSSCIATNLPELLPYCYCID